MAGGSGPQERVLILDFGSQYTQLIARRVREIGVYCEVLPYTSEVQLDEGLRGIILSGSPCSVHDADAPMVEVEAFLGKLPVLGICYGAQLLAKLHGGEVSRSDAREYGRAELLVRGQSEMLRGVPASSTVWMSHGDTITALPDGWDVVGYTQSIPVAAFEAMDGMVSGVQFHPEVSHSEHGMQMLRNFLVGSCGCACDWTPAGFVEHTIAQLRAQLGDDGVVLGLSGGVDSSVAAMLLHRAIGPRLTCIFVDHGLLRKDEFSEVLESYRGLGLNVIGVDAKERFFRALEGKTDPEDKRKTIGACFVEEFDREAAKLQGVAWLGQGTIYPDVIESVSVKGPSVTIKSHHNVGGLPKDMKLKVVEPLRLLFKDEVRRVGRELGLPSLILDRHPFPGPGLGIRILGEVTPERVAVLQEADAIYMRTLREAGLYEEIWQAGAILLPIKSVGVMGDERTYESVVALRAVVSVDAMTADWYHLPYEVLAQVSNDIINNVRGVNRVVYDISSKPPATIEWE
ncbi:MAG: glutamine-hydrolyzing GMP synthase [Bacteroidia bacterium]|nr:MAG: glutamine-hydrolyzing GMP synthase [Bacteroidia bacterium]